MIYNIIVTLILIWAVILIYFLLKRLVTLHDRLDTLQEQLESNMGKTDLELATVQQILSELVKRPNYRFMFIVPYLMQTEKEAHALNVEVHSSNVSVRMALDVLKATYQGVVNSIRHNNPDEDIDEDLY